MKQILIVEDNPVNITLIINMLGDDFDIVVSTDAEDAKEHLLTEKPDVILSDIYLGNTNGLELCKSVKSSPNLKDIPVIVMTAASSPTIKDEAFQAGADYFLEVPFKNESLIYALAEALE